jgi:hypothetical protein
LLEELRRDLPNVRNCHDSDAVALRQAMSPGLVLAALDERGKPSVKRNRMQKSQIDWKAIPSAQMCRC